MFAKNCILTALILAAFMGGECLAAKSPLIGSWKWDNEKTLEEFRLLTKASDGMNGSTSKTEQFLAARLKHRLNVTFTYTEKRCIQITFDERGNLLGKESFPYRIVQSGKDFAVVNHFKNGGESKLFFRGGGDSFYVEVHTRDYEFRDYFTRL
jgi:hypothetical protein